MARPYNTTGPIGTHGTLGLIVLQVDETVEQDFRRMFRDPDVAVYVTRIPSGADLTPQTIARMEADLPQAASLLPQAARFDVVGYACTSGTTLIGAGRVAELVAGNVATRAVTDPLSATIAALHAVKARAVAIVSPYIEPVATPVRQALCAAGFSVPAAVSFGETSEARVARIDPGALTEAAIEACQTDGVEAVFLSCTNLRTLDIIDSLESRLGIPVISSNQALAWDMARRARIRPAARAPGQLFRNM